MRHHALAAPLVVAFSLLLTAGAVVTLGTVAGPTYVCPPCDLPCDSRTFDKPGTCPQCGMTLVDRATLVAAQPRAPRTKVGILVFDGVEIIDFTGPWEIFGAAGYEVYTVAASKDPVTTAMGMTVVPKYTFADAPAPDVVVVPGGGVQGARGSTPTLAWLKRASEHAQHTMSVCNGAFILASAGLLEGLHATTTSGRIDQLHAEYPTVKVVYDQRVVDNGKIITAGGLSSGIDGALHVVSVMNGNGMAQAVALSEEYDWRPRSGYARAALADRLIPNVDMDALGDWTLIRTEGGTDRWEIAMRGRSDLSAAELRRRIGQTLASGKWVSVATKGSSAAPGISSWTFSGRDGKPWGGTLSVQPERGEDHHYTATLTIARVG